MGGDGFSSHAHDDFLSPILTLAGLPVLAIPAHSYTTATRNIESDFVMSMPTMQFSLANIPAAVQKLNFGWRRVRPTQKFLKAEFTPTEAIVSAQFGEWPQHARSIEMGPSSARIVDDFSAGIPESCQWWFHFDPIWKLESQTRLEFHFQDGSGEPAHRSI